MKKKYILDNNFKSAIKNLSNKPFPIKTALKVKKIISQMDTDFKEFEEMRKKRIVELSKKDKKGNPKILENGQYEITPENQAVLLKEIADFASQEIEMQKIKFSEVENIEFTASELIALEEILEE